MDSVRPPWTLRSDLVVAPISVFWETTKACLLARSHCRAKAIRQALPGELNHVHGVRLTDQLTEFGKPYPALLLTGGDPLMREDFLALIEHAKRKGIYVAVAASVTPKLNEESIPQMKDLSVDIMSLNLDGASQETHDRLRGVKGTWHATIRGLQVATQAGMKSQINTTVMSSNINELADVFHIARKNGSAAWEVFFLIRISRGASLENLSAQECEQVMNFLFDAAHYTIPVRTAEGPYFRRVRAQREKAAISPSGTFYHQLAARLHDLEGERTSPPSLKPTATRGGRRIIFVAYDGDVYQSGFLPLSTGRVPGDSLSSIYRSNHIFTALRNSNLKGRCRICEYKEACGASRFRTFAEFGDPFVEGPACGYIPKIESLATPPTPQLS